MTVPNSSQLDKLNVVYLMRGLPSSGKSTKAHKLAGERGRVMETDQFFYSQIGTPEHFDYDGDRLEEARQWNLNRFRDALAEKVTPIVVDRGNGRNPETRIYIELALKFGYRVELSEPDLPWWQELRVLLKYKQFVDPKFLDRWAEALADKSILTHRVPVETIRHWMQSWRADLTVDEILNYRSETERN